MDQDSKYYLYYEGNFIQNEICGKGIKYYINGSKKIEGIFESINSYEGKYYNPKGEEIYNGKIINEVPMNFKDKILYNDLGLIVYDGKIYNGGYKNEKKESKFNKKEIRRLKRLSVTFLSIGRSGKTSLIRNLEGKEFDEYIPYTNMNYGKKEYYYNYQYNNNQYGLILYDTNGQERFKSISLSQGTRAKIIVYVFDLSEDKNISEEFINEFKEYYHFKTKVIYLVGNKLDMTIKNIENYRKEAKN